MNQGKALTGVSAVRVLPGPPDGEVLTAQDYLYTLIVKHPDGTLEPRVIGSIVDYLSLLMIRTR
jgi:mannitol 2-dehydrogenase